MKKSRILVVALVVIAVAAGVFLLKNGTSGGRPTSESVRIGAILPLTGDAAQYGNNDKEGILLAVNQINSKGGIQGRKVEVLFEDCQTDAKLALAAFNKLHMQGVEAIIDDAISTISLAVAPVLAPSKTVLISTGSSNPSLSGASPFFFRIWNSDAYEGVIASDYIKSAHSGSKVAILYINSDYGKGLLSVVTKALGSNAQIVATESFDKDARDFRSQVAKIKDTNPTVIYLVGYAAQTGPATRQLREAGVNAPIVGTVAMQDPEYLKLAGTSAEGVVYPFPTPPSGPVVEEFQSAFRQAYGKDPGLLNDCGYDAASLIISAMKSGAITGEQIRSHLAGTKNFQGASGTISFDSNGDVNKPMQMKIIRAGEFVPLD